MIPSVGTVGHSFGCVCLLLQKCPVTEADNLFLSYPSVLLEGSVEALDADSSEWTSPRHCPAVPTVLPLPLLCLSLTIFRYNFLLLLILDSFTVFWIWGMVSRFLAGCEQLSCRSLIL